MQCNLKISFSHLVDFIPNQSRGQHNICFLHVWARKRLVVHIMRRNPLVIRTTPNLLHSTLDQVLHYSLLLVISSSISWHTQVRIRSSHHGSYRSVGKGEKPMYVIAIICVSNQMVTTSKGIDRRLDFDEPIKFIIGRENDPLIRMQLTCTQHVVSKGKEYLIV